MPNIAAVSNISPPRTARGVVVPQRVFRLAEMSGVSNQVLGLISLAAEGREAAIKELEHDHFITIEPLGDQKFEVVQRCVFELGKYN